MFFLLKVYLKKGDSPFKISTKVKEMQMSYDLFQDSTARDSHTLFGVSCWISFRSFKAVVSTGQFRDKKRGPWQFVSQLQLVLWECLTSFLGISAFRFRTPEAEVEALGSPWHRIGF